jgi:hypothetical protein
VLLKMLHGAPAVPSRETGRDLCGRAFLGRLSVAYDRLVVPGRALIRFGLR